MTEIAGIENPAVELLLALELSEMPDLACESVNHEDELASGGHSEGPATHYALMVHQCSPGNIPQGRVYAICEGMAQRLKSLRNRRGNKIRCLNCRSLFTRPDDWVRLVGPIGGKK